MNNNFTPEKKLRIIDLLAVTQSKEEFLDAVNKLLSEKSVFFKFDVENFV